MPWPTRHTVQRELHRAALVGEGDDDNHFPPPSVRGVAGQSGVVLCESQRDVRGQPGLEPPRVALALQDVDEPLRPGHVDARANERPEQSLRKLIDMCRVSARRMQILIGVEASKSAGLATRPVHLRGCPRSRFALRCAATVDTILRSSQGGEPCGETRMHGLPSEARAKRERRMVSRLGIEPRTRRLRVCCSAN